MGQRLNIEIVQAEEVLANSYYHWSAYTSEAISLTKDIIKAAGASKGMIPLKRAVFLLQTTGAGFTEDEMGFAKSIDDLKSEALRCTEGRNEGLIGVSEKAINMTRKWEEGRVTIDIEKETINFRVWWESSEEDFGIDYPDGKLVDLDANLECITFDKFNDFAEAFVWQEGVTDGFRIDGKIIIPIE